MMSTYDGTDIVTIDLTAESWITTLKQYKYIHKKIYHYDINRYVYVK